MKIWIAQYQTRWMRQDFVLGYWTKEPTKEQIVEYLTKQYPFEEYEIDFNDIEYDIYSLDCIDR